MLEFIYPKDRAVYPALFYKALEINGIMCVPADVLHLDTDVFYLERGNFAIWIFAH